MKDSAHDDVLRWQSREAMEYSTVVMTRRGVIASNEIDRLLWTTAIEQRLNKSTIIEFHLETILHVMEIDFHFDEDQHGEKKSDTHDQNHLLFQKIHSLQ
jgi:hypothetical protein